MGLGFSLNDSKWLGAFALNPSILFRLRDHGEALVADGKKGIYMQLGLAPGIPFFAESTYPVTISLPMTFGFSLKDYYTVNGENQTFGYFSWGPLITMPLKFIPAKFGSWSAKAGAVPDAQQQPQGGQHGGDGFVPIRSVGLALTY